MPYRIRYVAAAVAQMRHLSAAQRSRIMDAVDEQLQFQPAVSTRNRKQMRANPLAPWELRVGDLRAFYDIDEGRQTVVVLSVGIKRGERVVIGGEELDL